MRSIGLIQLLLFVGFVIARLPSVLVFVGLVGVVGLGLFAVAGLRWWRFTFEIEGEELVVRRGVVQQQRLSIPLGRVQSVSLEQKLLHRIVSLVQISLETAGTETAEFVIDAVDQRTASALQQTIANYRRPTRVVAGGDEQPDTFPPRPEQTVVHHNPR
ncbi:PH domain-containing protein, partial [Acidimicrobiales bacterium]|nr:PH domain-containing protein [Acidimicrobiales bacterium]